ncbi:unnamed protein product, partial [Symbiodinium pilosum]
WTMLWDLGRPGRLISLESFACRRYQVLPPAKTSIYFVMFDHANLSKSWEDVAWVFRSLDGQTTVSMFMIPMNTSAGSWGDTQYVIEREDGAVVVSGTLGAPGAANAIDIGGGHAELDEFSAVAGEI